MSQGEDLPRDRVAERLAKGIDRPTRLPARLVQAGQGCGVPDAMDPSDRAEAQRPCGEGGTHVHTGHMHVHGPGCGHPMVEHGDHVDFQHGNHRHASHGHHYDEH